MIGVKGNYVASTEITIIFTCDSLPSTLFVIEFIAVSDLNFMQDVKEIIMMVSVFISSHKLFHRLEKSLIPLHSASPWQGLALNRYQVL